MAFSEGNEALCGALAAVAPTIWSLPWPERLLKQKLFDI
jgi:hypothetical protein